MTDYIINYSGQQPEVRKWLIANIPYKTLYRYHSALDSKNRWVWRMHLTGKNQVLFNDPEYATLFALTWGQS